MHFLNLNTAPLKINKAHNFDFCLQLKKKCAERLITYKGKQIFSDLTLNLHLCWSVGFHFSQLYVWKKVVFLQAQRNVELQMQLMRCLASSQCPLKVCILLSLLLNGPKLQFRKAAAALEREGKIQLFPFPLAHNKEKHCIYFAANGKQMNIADTWCYPKTGQDESHRNLP